MATYPGNASLSSAVKDRVLSTFQQTLALYKQGRSAEVVEGCTLILRMDPTFDPARKLLEKTRNPNASIDIDSLMPADAGSDALNEARAALAARDFQRASDLTSEVLRNDFTNEEARMVNDTAREKIEAAPFVEQFIRKAEMFAAQGNTAASRAELEKARALDGEHPGIRRVAESMAAPETAVPSFSSGGSPSFVVETPPPAPSARNAAQATDFGFTFEEEKPAAAEPSFGGFSFDAPAPAAPSAPVSGFSFDTPAVTPQAPAPAPPVSGGFSFDTPAAPASGGFGFTPTADAASGDDQRKIQQYLADGDRAARAGDYQQAIDLWSRIFLIDVTNDEASHRIESAKVKRREIEGRVETIIAAGEQAFNAGDQATARTKFNEALRLDPGNLTAHDFIERMTKTVVEGGAAAFESPFVPPTPSQPHGDIFDDEISGSYDSLKPPELTPAKKAVKAKPIEPAPAKRGSRTGVLATLAAVVVVAGLGWFVWSKYMAKPAYDPSATQAIFRQAEALAKRTRFDQAIAMLRDVKPADPQHDKALEMIADLQHKKSQAAAMVNGRPSAVVYDESITAGRAAFDGHDYDAAKTAFDTAARIKPLPPDVSTMYATASQQVAKLDVAKAMFSEQKYQDAIANLDPLLQADPQNQSIRRMLAGAHFNLGAAALADERLPDAIVQFDNVLKIDPNDELAKRSKTLSERYSGQTKDLLFKIYVKYLPLRKVT
ncbi:MAG TPA: tetratricopeptide repeat protein [Thermoanaerobaculia bacterium]|nr:tetratricopeptide repeat protein [Thermoanaerobaculia bacterium]